MTDSPTPDLLKAVERVTYALDHAPFGSTRIVYSGHAIEVADLRLLLSALQPPVPAGDVAADDPIFDATDAAHPAWWRAHDHTSKVFCELVTNILDGKDEGYGFNHEPWGAVRRRLLALAAIPPDPRIARLEAALRPFADLYDQIITDHGVDWFADEGQAMRAALSYPVAHSAVVWRHFRLASEARAALNHSGDA